MNTFKNKSNRWLTNALFYELTLPETRKHAMFTLKEDDHAVGRVTYPSLKRLYLNMGDPTEYKFATRVLGGWSHWKELQECVNIKDHIEEWREELDAKLRSEGVIKAIELATKEDASFQATKYLTELGWKDKGGKGRPSKAQVKKATDELAQRRDRVAGDLARLKDG